ICWAELPGADNQTDKRGRDRQVQKLSPALSPPPPTDGRAPNPIPHKIGIAPAPPPHPPVRRRGESPSASLPDASRSPPPRPFHPAPPAPPPRPQIFLEAVELTGHTNSAASAS